MQESQPHIISSLLSHFNADLNGNDPFRVHDMIFSLCRVPNEWGFGRVVNSFQTLQFSRALRSSWTHPEQSYFAAIELANCLVCAFGAQHERYFNVGAPSLEEYIQEMLRP